MSEILVYPLVDKNLTIAYINQNLKVNLCGAIKYHIVTVPRLSTPPDGTLSRRTTEQKFLDMFVGDTTISVRD